MKTIIQTTLIILSFLLVNSLFGQNGSPSYKVHQVYPYISISKAELTKVNTLYDFKNNRNNIHLEYQPGWVERYISVEIQVCHDGQIKKAIGKTDILTTEQKNLLANADTEKDIEVHIHYWPKNNLVHNEPKTIDFSISLDPENVATFSGGTESLNRYLEQNVINKISASSFKEYQMAAIKFTINKAGNIQQAEIFGSQYQSGNLDEINKKILTSVQEMPRWKPASYENGMAAEQAFVLTVGSEENCVMPLLNIERDL